MNKRRRLLSLVSYLVLSVGKKFEQHIGQVLEVDTDQ
jgi:hypothetical protein